MSKPLPTIKRYMSTSPHTIGVDQKLARAHRLMRDHQIRHLPVLHDGRLVGVISDRDLHLIETLRDVDPDKVTIEEAMTPVVYTVSPEAALFEVSREMAEHKYGCAIVSEQSRVVGVFTTTDGMRALSDLLDPDLER